MPRIQRALTSLAAELGRWAGGDAFWPVLADVFGVSEGHAAAHAIQDQLRRGELSQLARFEVVGGALLGPARSAYASSTNTIYVSDRFLAEATSAQLQAVLLEEIGHAIDARVNLNDRPGDEGELFSLLVRGLTPTAGARQRLALEQDQRRITLDGAGLDMEQSLPLVYETKSFSLDGRLLAGGESGSYVYSSDFDLDGANAAWVTSKGANQLLRFLDGDSVAIIANSVHGTIENVDVDGGAVAYTKGNGRGTDVFQYRDGVTTKITERSGFYRDVQMDANTIVWQGFSEASGSVADLYRYDGGTIRRVTNNAVAEQDVQLSGSQLVWAAVGGRDAGDDHEIYLDDGAVTRQLTANAWDDYSPVVSGNRVAWYQWKDNQENLFFFNGTTSRQVTTNVEVDHPLIVGTNLVFQQPLANGSVALKFYNATTRMTRTLSSNLSSDDVQVSGNLVAWIEDGDLKLFNGSATRTIVDNLYSESGGYYSSDSYSRYALRGTKIVAAQRPVGDDSADGELYLYDVTNPAAGATRLTVGADVYSFRDLGISGDRILWRDGGVMNLTQPSTKPILSFANPAYSVVEGFASPQSAPLTVTLSSASREPVTVRYEAFTDWSDENEAFSGSDYSAVSGVLTFAAGVTSQTINVPILNDDWLESDKVFHVRLSAPSNAVLAPGQNQASVTISDTWRVTGGDGDSFTLPAGVENLTLAGTTRINGTGNANNNVIRGNSGNNRLDGGGGSDELIGGLGDDTYTRVTSSPLVTVREEVNQGIDTVEFSGDGSYFLGANLENLVLLGASDSWGMGNALANVITGNSGDNIINGASGSDTVSYAPAPAPVRVNLGSGAASGWGTDSLSSMENAVGSAFADTLEGSFSANLLSGGPGKDVLTGNGAGDTFDYRVLTDSLLSDASVDGVTDFSVSAGDRFLVAVARAGFLEAGQISTGVSDSDLTSAAIGARLTTAAFLPHFAAGFQMGSGPGMRSFVAINDAVAGYDAARDAVIEVTGLSGALSVSSFVTG